MRARLAIALVLVAATPVRAAVRLCLAVRGEEQDGDLRKLVEDELRHFPSHTPVADRCESLLTVELFTTAGQRYLTARVGEEVPVRYAFRDPRELAERLGEALRAVLDQDPVYLATDVTRMSALQRLGHSLLARGHNSYRLEVYGLYSSTGDGASLASGGAFSVSRGADHWRVFARAYGGGSNAGATARQVLRFQAGADAGLVFEASERARSTVYVAVGLGLQVRGFDGRLTPGDPRSGATAIQTDPVVSLRVGVRLLRVFDFDADVFALGYLPLYPPDPTSSALPQSWSPSLVFGLGVGF